jgi:hypothetical protein
LDAHRSNFGTLKDSDNDLPPRKVANVYRPGWIVETHSDSLVAEAKKVPCPVEVVASEPIDTVSFFKEDLGRE